MKTIEQIKIELTLKKLRGDRPTLEDIKDLPKNDDVRTFICELDSFAAYLYAKWVDNGPCDETRNAAYRMPLMKRAYIRFLGE